MKINIGKVISKIREVHSPEVLKLGSVFLLFGYISNLLSLLLLLGSQSSQLVRLLWGLTLAGSSLIAFKRAPKIEQNSSGTFFGLEKRIFFEKVSLAGVIAGASNAAYAVGFGYSQTSFVNLLLLGFLSAFSALFASSALVGLSLLVGAGRPLGVFSNVFGDWNQQFLLASIASLSALFLPGSKTLSFLIVSAGAGVSGLVSHKLSSHKNKYQWVDTSTSSDRTHENI